MSGTLFIVSAPSGAGKTSLIASILDQLSGLQLSVSHTTRAMRQGEVDGESYHFVSIEQFKALLAQNDFLEHAEVFGNFYGTSKSAVMSALNQHDVLLEIDWQGALQVKEQFPEAVLIFIMPPSLEALKSRLQGRGQDSEETIARRLEGSRREVAAAEHYDYILVNDQFEQAADELKAIFVAEKCKKARVLSQNDQLFAHFLNSD